MMRSLNNCEKMAGTLTLRGVTNDRSPITTYPLGRLPDGGSMGVS